jgi:RNA polymerase sigma-70 factor (ECF subfamily)
LNDTDLQDVRLAQGGDGDAFARLIRSSKASMYRVARSYGLSESDCGDVLQEAIVRSYRSLAQLQTAEYFRTWLIRIVMNEAKRLLASQKRVVPMSQVAVLEPSASSTVQTELEVHEAIAELDDELKEIVLLYYMEDISARKIAELLSVPEGTVKSRLSRARTKLAALLRPYQEGSLCHE